MLAAPLLSVVVVLAYLPETAARELEEIALDEELMPGPRAREGVET
jgi:hypothetical protein